jgi:hypothetical protein
MNFCKDCKHLLISEPPIGSHDPVVYLCHHPAEANPNYITGHVLFPRCYDVRFNYPVCEQFESILPKSTAWARFKRWLSNPPHHIPGSNL